MLKEADDYWGYWGVIPMFSHTSTESPPSPLEHPYLQVTGGNVTHAGIPAGNAVLVAQAPVCMGGLVGWGGVWYVGLERRGQG